MCLVLFYILIDINVVSKSCATHTVERSIITFEKHLINNYPVTTEILTNV